VAAAAIQRSPAGDPEVSHGGSTQVAARARVPIAGGRVRPAESAATWAWISGVNFRWVRRIGSSPGGT